jgi:hypothetical protein
MRRVQLPGLIATISYDTQLGNVVCSQFALIGGNL